MKKKFLAAAASTAMLSSLMFAGSALAVDRVEVKVTSEPIQSGAACDKAGGFTLEFDSTTSIVGGDRITIDVDYVDATNFAELCRDIDIMIAPANDGTTNLTAADAIVSTGWGDGGLGTVLIPGLGSPVTQVGAAVAVDGGVIFHVTGNANTQRITVDVISADTNDDGLVTGSSVTVGGGADDVIAVAFLDQAINADYATPGIWTDDDGDFIYDDAADVEDNTLCIDVQDWGGATVNGNMDSAADKYTFIPSNPQIAHIVAAANYETVACKGANCGDIVIGTTEQAGDTCGNIDNEAPDALDSAYCATGNVHLNNHLIITRTDDDFDVTDYNISMAILVNGETGDNGVYFTNDPLTTLASTTESDACDGIGAAAAPATNYYLESGSAAVPVIGDVADCSIDAAARAVSLMTVADTLGMTGAEDYLSIDIPEMHYDLQEVEAGDEISVEITLTKAPCGELLSTTHCIGTLVDQCTVIASGNTITYPYFSQASGDSFWDGIAVTNMSSAAGDVTFTMYETDGDVATATVNVGANSMYVNTLGNMISSGAFTITTSGDGTLGNARSYIMATGDGIMIDGFAMLANEGTGESMGYLPRQ